MLNKFLRTTKKYLSFGEKVNPRWASPDNLYQSGLLNANGATLAKSDNNYLRSKLNEHVLVVGPCRSGKTVGIAIPTLLSYQDSVVVLDMNQEKYDLTAGYRRDELGQEVYIFGPLSDYALDG
jgi:type IV secretion system protein VirD4